MAQYLDEVRTQELINEIKSRLSGKANTATSISGYGIEDAYTKTEVDNKVSAAIGSVFKPAGSVAFADLPALSEANLGKVVNVTNAFNSTTDFVEGAGNSYPAGTNVVIVDIGTAEAPSYKYDVLSGFVDLTNYYNTTTLTAITQSDLAAMWED